MTTPEICDGLPIPPDHERFWRDPKDNQLPVQFLFPDYERGDYYNASVSDIASDGWLCGSDEDHEANKFILGDCRNAARCYWLDRAAPLDAIVKAGISAVLGDNPATDRTKYLEAMDERDDCLKYAEQCKNWRVK